VREFVHNLGAVPPGALHPCTGLPFGETHVCDDPRDLECPPACSTHWEAGTRVPLVLVEPDDTETVFVGWREACTGTEECMPTVDRPTMVEAVFGPRPPVAFALRVTVVGSGRVVTTGWRCARRCVDEFSAGDEYLFRAEPRRGWRFADSSGACRGRRACVVRFSSDKTLLATFRRR
jgi:hypothetical protein